MIIEKVDKYMVFCLNVYDLVLTSNMCFTLIITPKEKSKKASVTHLKKNQIFESDKENTNRNVEGY